MQKKSLESLFPDQPYPLQHHVTLRSQPADAESERPPAARQLRQQLEPPPGREFPGQFPQGLGWSREKQNGEQPRDTDQSSGAAQELDVFCVMGGGGWVSGGGAAGLSSILCLGLYHLVCRQLWATPEGKLS